MDKGKPEYEVHIARIVKGERGREEWEHYAELRKTGAGWGIGWETTHGHLTEDLEGDLEGRLYTVLRSMQREGRQAPAQVSVHTPEPDPWERPLPHEYREEADYTIRIERSDESSLRNAAADVAGRIAWLESEVSDTA